MDIKELLLHYSSSQLLPNNKIKHKIKKNKNCWNNKEIEEVPEEESLKIEDVVVGDEVEKRGGRLSKPQDRWVVVGESGLNTAVVAMEIAVAVDMVQSGQSNFISFLY